MNVYSVSLGCPKNRVDTERLLGALGPITPVDSPALADLALINTCGFIQPAIEESLKVILEATEGLPSMGRRPLVAVAGCLVSRFGQAELAPELPDVDLWLSTRELDAWPSMLARAFERAGRPTPDMRPMARRLSTGPSYAYLKIGEGCGHACAFCAIPGIRGPLKSRPVDSLREEAQSLLDQGVKELVLVAQDLTSYGRDLRVLGDAQGPRLERLLEALLPLDGLKRLRLMYLYPAGLTESLLGFLAGAGPPLVPYFDIPLQHAHSEILAAMGRPFAADPRRVIDRVRSFFPDPALRTSLMVGFPGEKERHFQALMDFAQEVRFNHLGVFAFSPEQGTAAAALKGRVPARVKEERRKALMAMQAEISRELLERHVNETLEVLVDRPHPEWPGLFVGRTWFQAPEADGITYVSGLDIAPGDLVAAEIEEATDYDLTALVE